MDPSSSNSLEPGGTHRALEPKQVFLSHSGAQKEFVEVLREEVLRSDRSAFFDIDRESLPIGVHFPHYIFDAIKQCKVGILILSEEFFTHSKWPMLELAALYERRDEPNFRIIPVFLNITRDECRKKENHIRWFFEWCKWGISKDELEKWKKAMEIFGPTNGLIYRDGTSKCDLRRDIVDAICQCVPSESTWGIYDVQGSEGIYKAIQGKFDATQVSQRYGVRVVGLYGMGGIGKTTTCKVLCNKLFSDFCGRVCHGEYKESNELEMLKEVGKRLTSTKQDVLENYNFDQCCDQLQSAMHKRKVFLAMDNVFGSMVDLTKKLLRMRYAKGSIVLVTARTRYVLTSRVGTAECDCMEMPDLAKDDAKSLFLHHASPVKEVTEDCVNKCIKQCYFGKGDGVKSHYYPLALKVLDSQFLDVDPLNWVEKLDDLDKFNLFGDKEHPIFSILKRTFDGLEPKDQMLFMDAAIFYPVHHSVHHSAELYGVDVDREEGDVKWKADINIIEWLGMVHGQQVDGIKKRLESLRKRSLIEDWGDGSRRIGMHDLWIEFAHADAKGGDSRERAWLYEPVDGANDGRRKPSCLVGGGWNQLERIYLKGSTDGRGVLKSLNLKRCSKLTVLKVVGVHIESGVLDLKRTKCLKSLEIVVARDRSATVKNICRLGCVRNLVDMRLSGIDFSSQFLDEVKGLTNLEVLHLSGYTMASPHSSKLPDLSRLSLLSNVNLCSKAVSTISGLNSSLAHLRYLELSHCTSLTSCPGVDALFVLEELSLHDCRGLKELPNLQQLKRLQRLVISQTSLTAVPGLGDLVALVVFDAHFSSLAVLPNMRKLSKLQILNLELCELKEVDSGLRDLIALEEFEGPYEVLETSTDLQNLRKLVTLNVDGWSLHGPQVVANLANLQTLKITDLEGVHELGGLLNLTRLQYLELYICGFEDVSCLSNLIVLQRITIHNCDKLKKLPDMHRLTRLETLNISQCPNLREWTGAGVHRVGTLPLLQTLEFWKVPIVELPDLSWFPQLRTLYIHSCKRLKRLTSAEPMTALEWLSLSSCKSLKEVPDFSHSKLLRHFDLDYSDGVVLSAGKIEKLKAMCPGLEISWEHGEPPDWDVDLDGSSEGDDGSNYEILEWGTDSDGSSKQEHGFVEGRNAKRARSDMT